jgi:hypothetical protein
MERERKMKDSNNQNNDVSVHNDLALSSIIGDIKEHLGIILVAEAGHGKSYTAFSLVKEAMKDPNFTVIVLSPSTIWRRNFGAITCVKVGTSDFNPIIETPKTTVESVSFLRDAVHINLDKKWSYVQNNWFERLLTSERTLLFEIKYRNGRRIKAFESWVLQSIYEQQEKAIDRDPTYKHHYLIVLEEIQNSFGTYSMNSDDSLDLMTIFTQSRSDANVHYIGIGQRLNDISTKVIERLRPFVGLTLGENSLRKIKSQLPDSLKDRVQQLPKRHWLYLDGKTNPEITIHEYRKEGTATLLRPKPNIQQPKPSLRERFKKWLNGSNYKAPTKEEIAESEELERQSRADSQEDSEGDGLMSEGDIIFPEEI